jgi:hypothetical protein
MIIYVYVFAILLLIGFLLDANLLINRGCGSCHIHRFTQKLHLSNDGLMRIIATKGTREVTAHGATIKIGGPDMRATMPLLYSDLTSKTAIRRYSEMVGQRVYLGDRSNPNSIFVKSYQGEADSIGWHRDPNHTMGKRYTAIVALSVSPCNTSQLQTKMQDGRVQGIDLRPGQGVMFDASEIFHRVTPQTGDIGCYRVVVVIPLYTDPRPSPIGILRKWTRRILLGI